MIEHSFSTWDEIRNQIISNDFTFIIATDPANKSTTDIMTSLEARIQKLIKLVKYQEVSALNDQNSFDR